MQEVSFNVQLDENGNGSVTIVGDYWQGKTDKGILLLHMMPATRESWHDIAEKLNQNGYHVLAIDLRGHGDSYNAVLTEGKEVFLNYSNFKDLDHQRSIIDVQAGVDFLIKKGVARESLQIGGASIGANLTIQYMSENHFVTKGFALSPGLDYHGIKTKKAFESMFLDQHILLTTGESDRYSSHSVNVLAGVGEVQKTIKYFQTADHGTTLFESHPELMSELVNWLIG